MNELMDLLFKELEVLLKEKPELRNDPKVQKSIAFMNETRRQRETIKRSN